MEKLKVLILIGSLSDQAKMFPAKKILDGWGVVCEMMITSAHRTSDRTDEIVLEATEAGCKIFICGAGMAAHLAGYVAAKTVSPVIGVPLTSGASPLNGVDALLSTLQMPSGIPVATMPINGAKNAAHLAAEMLALSDPDLLVKILASREDAAAGVVNDNAKLQTNLDKLSEKEETP